MVRCVTDVAGESGEPVSVRNEPVKAVTENGMTEAFNALVEGFGPTVTITELPQVSETQAPHHERARLGRCRPGEHYWPGELGDESSPCCERCGLPYREWSEGM